jgi:hypothetical protein
VTDNALAIGLVKSPLPYWPRNPLLDTTAAAKGRPLLFFVCKATDAMIRTLSKRTDNDLHLMGGSPKDDCAGSHFLELVTRRRLSESMRLLANRQIHTEARELSARD